MLPPGILVWKSGDGDHVSPTTPSAIAEAHPTWAKDIATYGPWTETLVDERAGTFLIGPGVVDETVVVTGRCETTMTTARTLAEAGIIGEWGSVVSVEQVSARGQLRRPWVSSPGNLHASFVMPAASLQGAWASELANLRPLVAGFIFSTILQYLGANIQIKWPNDLLQFGRKVGGMLIEEKNGTVILGLGLNLVASPPDEKMREDRSVPAGILQIQNDLGGALALWQTLVSRGKSVYGILLDEFKPSRFLSNTLSRLAWLGQRVRVRDGGRDEYQAVVTGLSSKGGLVLAYEGKETILYSGSIYPI